MSSADDIAADERRLAELDAQREPVLARLRAARAEASAPKQVKVFDPSSAGHADDHWKSARWPKWQKFEPSASSVLEVLVERLVHTPAEVPIADAQSMDRSPYRRGPDTHRAVAHRGDRITIAAHLCHDLVQAGYVRRSADQDSPPTEPRWSPLPWAARKTAAQEAMDLHRANPVRRP